MGTTTIHTVKKGESLSRIAQFYGLRNFELIYKDPVNAKFRKTRPKPDLIQPGDKVVIPNFALTPGKRKDLKTLISTVDARLSRLERNRKDLIATTKELAGEISTYKSKFKKTKNAADGAALIITLLLSVTKISAIGLKAATQTTTELAKANKEILKELGKMSLTAVEPALGAGADKMASSSSKGIAVIGILADSFFKLSSPSFWAKTYMKAQDEKLLDKIIKGKFGQGWDAWSKAVTWDPLAEFDRMQTNMKAQSEKLVKQLDLLIAENKKLLQGLKGLASK
ncbi:MAG: LysM peptidoglycan-binding domain-containing protein [Rhodobacteraceae bacterium]|nr:LysM peptidoglycan-binding domain-containing protein [Paracoccaceae bacterium]